MQVCAGQPDGVKHQRLVAALASLGPAPEPDERVSKVAGLEGAARTGEAGPFGVRQPFDAGGERLLVAADHREGVREIDVRAGRLLHVADPQRDRQPLAQRGDAGLDLPAVGQRGPERGQRARLLALASRGPSGSDGLGTDVLGLHGRRGEHDAAGEGGEHDGALPGRLALRQQPQGGLQLRQRIGVAGLELQHRPPCHQLRRGRGRGYSVDLLEGLLEIGVGAAVVAGGRCGQRRELEQLDVRDGRLLLGLRNGRPDLQRPSRMLLGLGERERRGCLPRGKDRCRQGARQVVGGEPVVGLAGSREAGGEARGRGQGFCVCAVERHELAGEHVVVHRLARQDMAKRIATTVVVHRHEVVLDGLPQPRRELVVGYVGHLGDQQVLHPVTPGRRHPHHAPPRLGQPLHPVEQHVGQRRGHVALLTQLEDLLDQEGVALRPGEHLGHQRTVGLVAEDAGELLCHGRPVEAVELDAQHLAHALQQGEHRPQRVAPVDLVRAIAQHEQHGCVAQRPGEEHDQVERRPVGPVQVLDHEYERPVCGDAGEHGEEQLEHPAPAELTGRLASCWRRAELGEQPRQIVAR